MIFKPELVEKILAGEKTETRRPVKPGETECRYKEGRTYAVQPGRTKPGVARIKVLEVRRELLYAISEQSAIREGFPATFSSTGHLLPSQDRFLDYWSRLYGGVPEVDEEVWAIRFELEKTNEERSVS